MLDRVRMLCLALLVAATQGCVKQDGIREQRVPKQPTVDVLTPDAPENPHTPAAESKEAIPGRMLAAIVPVGGKAWFFKILGASDPVAAQKDNFMALLKSLKSDGIKLSWTTPEDWDEERGAGMRAATFRFTSDGEKLECSVIPLPAEDPESPEYILANINRWRGQLGLDAISTDDVPTDEDEFFHFKLDNGTQITSVNIEGTIAGKGGPPMMAQPGGRPAGPASPAGPQLPAGHPPTTGTSSPPATGANVVKEIPQMSFDVPAGWKPKANSSSFRKISWDLSRDDQSAEMYISTLAAGGSDIAANVSRWRGQVGLDALDGAALLDTVDEISIGGITGHVSDMIGEEKAILAAIVVEGQTGWFFTLKAPAAIAEAESDNFRSFLKSVKFK